MSSPDAATGLADPLDRLPPALSSMWRLCRLGYRYEPALMGIAFVLALVAAVPDALLALWFKLLGEGLLEHNPGLLRFAVVALAVSAVATWLLQTVSTRLQRRFRDKVTIALESHVARLQASISTIAHQERPEYLDRLSVLREQIFTLDHMYMSVFSTAGWLLRLAITVALLATVNPVLVTLVLFAIPTVAATSWRPVVERTAQERGAQADRLAAHLFTLTTTASPGKELRVLGIGGALAERRRAAWEQWYGPVAAARTRSSAWYAAGWAIFAFGLRGRDRAGRDGPARVGRIGHPGADRGRPAVVLRRRHGRARSASCAASGWTGRGGWPGWRTTPAPWRSTPTCPRPTASPTASGSSTLRSATRDPTRPALDDVDLFLPSARVVAVVGENGAGKTTLVKLLAKLYAPSSGRILVDGTDLARIDPAQWRQRLAGAFQDFFRFEFQAGQTIGLGDLPRLDVEPALVTATGPGGRAGRRRRLARRPAHAARPDLARRRRRLLRPVAEARAGPRLHARRAADRGAGRADGRARRRDRAPAVRALRQPGREPPGRTAA